MRSQLTAPRNVHSHCLALCIALASTGQIGCRSTAQTAAPPPPAGGATPMVVRMTEWDEYTGRFEATDRVDVRARVDGYLDSIHFRDGAIVKPGELLFVIDPRPVRSGPGRGARRRRARGDSCGTGDDRLHSRRGAVCDPGHQPRGIDRRTQAKKEAEAALIVARAAERVAALNVEFTQVRAPIGGRISQKFVSVGNVISGGQAGSTVLTTIVAVDPIQFVFDASESDYLNTTV